MSAARLFLPKASPISMIGIEALMPMLTVTIMLTDELHAPPAGGAGSVAPTGNATLVVEESGAGAVDDQVADIGAVVSAEVVYSVPTGKLCPDFRTVFTGIGAIM